MMIRSLRLRLAAWYLAYFSLLFLLFSVFLYGMLARALQNRLDQTLAAEAEVTGGLLADELVEMRGDIAKASAEAVSEMRIQGNVVAIFQGSRMLAASGAVPKAELAALAQRVPADAVVPARGARVAVHHRNGYAILAYGPLAPVAADLQLLREVLSFGVPLLLLLSGVGGYLLATRSMAPLRWMADQARQITGNSLHRRLETGDAAEELQLLGKSFNELLARLDQSFESMRRFVADASHELRTPLSVIRGEADVALSQERTASEYRESLAVVLDESRRLSDLVEDLLNLARADSGRLKLNLEDFYFNELVTECCRSLAPLAAARQVRLECLSETDVALRGDERLLRRLVVNLVDNAIRYTPAGGKVTAAVELENQAVRLRVSDTGPGIPADALPHLFERFYRVSRARSREESGGFGLGLSIVKWIAETHHGAVGLESSPEKGTTFTITLPR
jgi:heavy metal sensor kinase